MNSQNLINHEEAQLRAPYVKTSYTGHNGVQSLRQAGMNAVVHCHSPITHYELDTKADVKTSAVPTSLRCPVQKHFPKEVLRL